MAETLLTFSREAQDSQENENSDNEFPELSGFTLNLIITAIHWFVSNAIGN